MTLAFKLKWNGFSVFLQSSDLQVFKATLNEIFTVHYSNRRIRLTCLHPCCHPIQITWWFIWEVTIEGLPAKRAYIAFLADFLIFGRLTCVDMKNIVPLLIVNCASFLRNNVCKKLSLWKTKEQKKPFPFFLPFFSTNFQAKEGPLAVYDNKRLQRCSFDLRQSKMLTSWSLQG